MVPAMTYRWFVHYSALVPGRGWVKARIEVGSRAEAEGFMRCVNLSPGMTAPWVECVW